MWRLCCYVWFLRLQSNFFYQHVAHKASFQLVVIARAQDKTENLGDFYLSWVSNCLAKKLKRNSSFYGGHLGKNPQYQPLSAEKCHRLVGLHRAPPVSLKKVWQYYCYNKRSPNSEVPTWSTIFYLYPIE